MESRPNVINLVDDEEHAYALDEIEGHVGAKKGDKGQGREEERRKSCITDGMDPVLEELPKWSLSADVLKEIERR